MDHTSMINFLIEEGRLHAQREQDLQRWFDGLRRSGRTPSWDDLSRLVEMQRETLQHQSTFCFAMISFVEHVRRDHQDTLEEMGEDLSQLLRARLRGRVRRALSGHEHARRAAALLRRLGDILDGGDHEPDLNEGPGGL